jgi:hypothetical protein
MLYTVRNYICGNVAPVSIHNQKSMLCWICRPCCRLKDYSELLICMTIRCLAAIAC